MKTDAGFSPGLLRETDVLGDLLHGMDFRLPTDAWKVVVGILRKKSIQTIDGFPAFRSCSLDVNNPDLMVFAMAELQAERVGRQGTLHTVSPFNDYDVGRLEVFAESQRLNVSVGFQAVQIDMNQGDGGRVFLYESKCGTRDVLFGYAESDSDSSGELGFSGSQLSGQGENRTASQDLGDLLA
ncbi:MAG: hypothetical protein R3B74_09975 [Nitrospirales bacterium]|nr:hypothetical protein [Nitrospirales bacterium]